MDDPIESLDAPHRSVPQIPVVLPAFTPPGGINLHCPANIPIGDLARALCRAAAFLQNLAPYAPLHRYDDWWEHDGLHFYRAPLDLHGLFSLVESPRALLEAMPGDDDVFVGIAPMDGAWYLRFYAAWDDDGWELLGRFDITLPADLAAPIAETVRERIDLVLEQQDATAYYQVVRHSP